MIPMERLPGPLARVIGITEGIPEAQECTFVGLEGAEGYLGPTLDVEGFSWAPRTAAQV